MNHYNLTISQRIRMRSVKVFCIDLGSYLDAAFLLGGQSERKHHAITQILRLPNNSIRVYCFYMRRGVSHFLSPNYYTLPDFHTNTKIL
jgi:hypothetical protein